MIVLEVSKEYERIRALFEGIDEKQMQLIDGAIWECARLRIELNNLYEIQNKCGSVKIHPDNPTLQKELPVSKVITKVRANYLNYISKLSNTLGKNINDDENDLEEFE